MFFAAATAGDCLSAALFEDAQGTMHVLCEAFNHCWRHLAMVTSLLFRRLIHTSVEWACHPILHLTRCLNVTWKCSKR